MKGTISGCWFRWVALAVFAVSANGRAPSPDPVPPNQVEALLRAAKPGATIVVNDGVYRDIVWNLSAEGRAEAPVTVRAQSPGGVVFTGRSGITLKANHVTIDGFLFRDGQSPGKTVVEITGSHCRLTNTAFSDYNPPDPETVEDKWVTLRGMHHTVDHCTFHHKTSKSVTLTVWREAGKPDHHRIAANLFLQRPRGAEGNGYETIRIGASDESESDSHTTVEGNLFERCDGEMECVSVKAGACVIRGNTFLETAGTLTLRHGRGSLVEGNLFAGKGREGTGGVRVYGADHRIKGNAFIGLTGRGGGALALMAGVPNPKLNGYQAVENLLVDGNLFAANRGPAVRLDAEYDDHDRPRLPAKITVRGNAFSGDELKGLVAGGDRSGVIGLEWTGNQVYAGNQIPSQVTGRFAPPLTRADVGAKWFLPDLP